jgi:hypothetical protein
LESSEHICTRMIAFIKAKGHVLSHWEAEQHKAGKGFSVGYLAKAASKNITIGLNLVEEFLAVFPEVDAYWLITGKELRRNTEESAKKLTAATNNEDAAVNGGMTSSDYLYETVQILRAENMKLLNIVELALKRGGSNGAE